MNYRIIYLMLFALPGALLAGCGKGSATSQALAGCDSVVITFNIPNGDSVVNRVSTTEKNAIKKLAAYLEGKELKQQDCGFDGNLTFFKSGEAILPVVFQYNTDSCRRFLFSLEGKTISTKMSNDAADFLKSLAEGRDWY